MQNTLLFNLVIELKHMHRRVILLDTVIHKYNLFVLAIIHIVQNSVHICINIYICIFLLCCILDLCNLSHKSFLCSSVYCDCSTWCVCPNYLYSYITLQMQLKPALYFMLCLHLPITSTNNYVLN